MKIFTFLLLSLGLFSSCIQTLEKEETISVKHFPVIQNNDVDNPTFWLQVQFSHDAETNQWTTIPLQAISGFDYELGYHYELQIKKQEVLEPSQSAYVEYILLDVINKERVGNATTFELPLKSTEFNPAQLVQGSATAGYSLINDLSIECTSLCESMEQRLENSSEVTGVFRHNFDGSIKLVSFK